MATVNARQNEILGVKRFAALLNLSKAFRFRPPAFNGGTRGAVMAPDVVVVSEFREANLEILGRLMDLKFDEPYEIVGPNDARGAFVVNTRTMELQGDVELIPDSCLRDQSSTDPKVNRSYPMARFKEVSSGALFTVVGVHLSVRYPATDDGVPCRVKNMQDIRNHIENEPGATFVAGDFNFHATVDPYECDPEELGEPAGWWSVLTNPQDGGRVYVDSVQRYRKSRGLPMANQWTHQQVASVQTCTGSMGIKRSRIDYIFASGVSVAEAGVDDPGWLDPVNPKYSDHRFVLGRYVLSGPPRTNRPTADLAPGGVIDVSWEPIVGATGWVVYRGRPGYAYTQITKLGPETTSYADRDTVHDKTYRYVIAALGADTGQGLESPPVWGTADARGPHVSGIVPGKAATNVDDRVKVRVSFDEFVAAASVTDTTISIYRNGRRVPGRLIRKGGFVLEFDPSFPLKKGDSYTLVVRPVRDVVGNTGPTFKSRFSTEQPPKKRRHGRR